jgi:hypothetical protein
MSMEENFFWGKGLKGLIEVFFVVVWVGFFCF